MKKYLTLLLMLMTVSWAGAASYQLWIAGVQVTDNNKNNITGSGIESAYSWDGKVSYDPTSKTLTLENICIKSDNDIGIRNEISGVTIWLKGRYNEVQDQWHTSKDGIVSVGNLTFDGEGILKVWGSMGIYIRPNTGDVTIDGDARVEVSGQDYSAIGTEYNSTGSLIVKGRKAMLMATSYSSPHDISGFKDLVLQDGITINRPTGVEYNTSTYCLRDGNSNVGSGTTVVIGKQIAINTTNFPNAELRRAVTEQDTDNNGYLDRDENYLFERLFLEGNQVDDLTGLNLLWDVKLIEAYQLAVEGITFSNNTLLETINFIVGNLEYLEVDNCLYLQSISAQHHKLSYMDLSSNKHLVNVSLNNNALISFIPPSSMPKDFRSDISLYGNKLTSSKMHTIVNKLMTYDNEPEKHSFNVISSLDVDNEQNQITAEDLAALKTKHWTPNHVCMEKGQRVWKEYEGYKEYDLWVGDNQKVTEANQNDIFGDGGGMMYNPTTKTLSLMNDYNFGTNGIQNYIDGLTIKCVDNSTLDCQSDAIDLYANTTITGNHRLAVKSKVGVGIFVDEGKTLTIDNATLEMSAQMPCILGATTTGSQKLNIKDSEIEAHSNSSSVAISGFPAGITFEGCAITEPAGGYVKDGNIVDKDGNWAYDVKIQKVDETVFSFALGDGIKQVDTYGNEQFTAINVLWTADILDSTYDQTTKTTTFFNKASGKNLFTLEPYNAKGDMAYFLCEGVTAEDAISYDFSDDRSWLVNTVYDYLNSYDAEDAEAFLVKYNSINLGFDIPAVPATEEWVGTMRNGMKLEEDETTLAASFVLLLFGDLTYESADDGSSSYYNAATNKLLFTINSDGIVTLGSGVTSADAVTHRIIQADREMMAEGTEALRSITLTFDDGAATGITQHPTPSTQHPVYNLNGQRVGNSYRGIAVSDGRKVVVK